LVHALTKKTPGVKLLALTATANKKTEEDIKNQLLVDHQTIAVHRESMNRPNIRLSITPVAGAATKLATLTELLATLTGSGLIYCATRENTELVAEFLNSQGIHAAAYHAGFETEQKRRIQDDFIHDKYTVIAATNALGMGIDKSNLRYIIHFDLPGSITAYYQEVGRSGRDGLPADGILLYDPADSKIQRHFIHSAQPTEGDFEYILKIISNSSTALNLATLKRTSGMHPTKLSVITAELVEQGFVQKASHNGYQTYQLTTQTGKPNLARYDTQHRVRNNELTNMKRYAELTHRCLMVVLREALGDINAQSCGQCCRCTNNSFAPSRDQDLITAISSWLDSRTIPIQLSKKINNTAVGMAVLDGKLRSDMFVQFMRERAGNNTTPLGMPDLLLQLIKACLLDLAKRHQFSCIIPIPSRTWAAQKQVVDHLAHYLRIPVIKNTLSWSNPPTSRQGELLNNDQRKHNVNQRMQVTSHPKIPKGTILLFDDYFGSGATMNEASRALREHGLLNNKIIPFAVAAVKWHLGKKGMI
jgi:ATP-dependent DNA helicase RecQ